MCISQHTLDIGTKLFCHCILVSAYQNTDGGWRKTVLLYVALQIDSTQFILCKELVDQQLLGFQPSNAVYIFNPANQNIQTHLDEKLPCCYSTVKTAMQTDPRARGNWSAPATFTLLKAKIHEDDMGTDEFYDGFKHLYNEDGSPDAGQTSAMGSNDDQRQEESNGSCPPLQPASQID